MTTVRKPVPFRHLVLLLDYREPGYALVDLKPVELQPLGWRFLARLAECPGSVVSYKQMYDELWGDTVVEPNQLSFQKTGVLAAIAEEVPRRRDMILTFPKMGFMLDLSPREVQILSPLSRTAFLPQLASLTEESLT